MNNKIKKTRQIALSLLKPSKKNLEHGFELHQNSIVCDSYGFAPSSAVDVDAFCKAIEEGASDIELVDLREEIYGFAKTHGRKVFHHSDGYIMSNGITVQADVPLDNMVAMIEEARKTRRDND